MFDSNKLIAPAPTHTFQTASAEQPLVRQDGGGGGERETLESPRQPAVCP